MTQDDLFRALHERYPAGFILVGNTGPLTERTFSGPLVAIQALVMNALLGALLAQPIEEQTPAKLAIARIVPKGPNV